MRSQFATSSLVSQNVTPQKHGGRRYLPYVFTEQGVSMLSAVLKSKTAIEVSIKIMDSFVSMRKFISFNNNLFQRLDAVEKRQLGYEIKSDEKFDKLFNALENKSLKPSHGIFYDGQMFDAYIFISDVIRGAKSNIVLIDNYIDDSVLTLFSKNQNIDVTIYTHSVSKQLKLDIRYNISMKTISILGSGWLGLPLALELSKKYQIKLSTRTVDKLKSLEVQNITPYIVDIDNSSQSIQEFLEADILIINIPSKKIEAFKKLAQYIDKSQVGKLIFISSTSVCRDDKSPLLEIEKIFQAMDNKTTILRFGGLIGYSRNPANFFKNNKLVPNPQTPVNMIHRDDCIGIIKEILKQDVFNEVFNCCSPTHPTKKEFYTHCAISSDLPIPIFDTVENKEQYTIIPIDKLQNKLNYKFIHPDLMKIKL